MSHRPARCASEAAQSKQAALERLLESRQRQVQLIKQPQQLPAGGFEDLEDSDFSTHSTEDESENRPPEGSPPASFAKPTLSRLKRNSVLQPAAGKIGGGEELVAGLQQLSIAKGQPSARDAAVRAGDDRPSNAGAPSQQAPRKDLLAAAHASKLPSDEGSSEESSDEAGAAGSDDGLSSTGPGASYAPSLTFQAASKTPPGPEPGALLLGKQQQYVLPALVNSKLYPHQVKGVRWLWSLYEQKRGGILGDDMGMGKTMQCCAFVAGLLQSNLAHRVLVVAPKTLLLHWEKELAVCGLAKRTHPFFEASTTARETALRTVAGRTGGVMLTTYGMVLHNAKQLSEAPAGGFGRRGRGGGEDEHRDFLWDVVILDEGHKVKNPKTKLVQALKTIPAGITVIISGTPIQNNLSELHALFDICCDGLLGDRRTFKTVYEKHINAGQDRGATAREREVGAAVADELRRKIAPYFLRRTKEDTLRGDAATSGGASSTQAAQPGTSSSTDTENGSSSTASGVVTAPKPLGLSHKNDLVVWLKLQPLQKAMYTAFLHSDAVKRALNETESALAALTVLKKICDHPALLTQAATDAIIAGGHRWGKQGHKTKGKHRARSSYSSEEEVSEEDSSEEEVEEKGREQEGAEDGAAVSSLLATLGADVRQQLQAELQHSAKAAEASCKTLFVLALLDELAARGHRTLVFSQSILMLDILQAAIVARDMAFCRIDGRIGSPQERDNIVKKFQQKGSTIPVFLLTSQVGGLGLTLTAADRVVIVDPAWNPAVDNQAVDRAYRIGQTRDVVVYRLITCGTVEEKIYRKQVFKAGLSRTGTEEGVQFRYFTRQQLADLFSVSEEGLAASTTQQQLHAQHAAQRKASAELKLHLQFLEGAQGYAGISDHNLLFSSKPAEQEGKLSAAQGQALVGHLERQATRSDSAWVPGVNRQSGARGMGGRNEDELSGLLAAVSLGGKAVTAEQAQAQAELAAQQRRVEELQQRLTSLRNTAAALAGKMVDGGAKLLRQQEVMAAELLTEQQKLASMQVAMLQGPANSISSIGGTGSTSGTGLVLGQPSLPARPDAAATVQGQSRQLAPGPGQQATTQQAEPGKATVPAAGAVQQPPVGASSQLQPPKPEPDSMPAIRTGVVAPPPQAIPAPPAVQQPRIKQEPGLPPPPSMSQAQLPAPQAHQRPQQAAHQQHIKEEPGLQVSSGMAQVQPLPIKQEPGLLQAAGSGVHQQQGVVAGRPQPGLVEADHNSFPVGSRWPDGAMPATNLKTPTPAFNLMTPTPASAGLETEVKQEPGANLPGTTGPGSATHSIGSAGHSTGGSRGLNLGYGRRRQQQLQQEQPSVQLAATPASYVSDGGHAGKAVAAAAAGTWRVAMPSPSAASESSFVTADSMTEGEASPEVTSSLRAGHASTGGGHTHVRVKAEIQQHATMRAAQVQQALTIAGATQSQVSSGLRGGVGAGAPHHPHQQPVQAGQGQPGGRAPAQGAKSTGRYDAVIDLTDL